MTLLDSRLGAAAAARPRVPRSSAQGSLPYRAATMSEFLLAFLTLSGLLPIAKVLTVGADRGKETTSPPSVRFHPRFSCWAMLADK